jgi:RND family efflux transporter MFP subunit
MDMIRHLTFKNKNVKQKRLLLGFYIFVFILFIIALLRIKDAILLRYDTEQLAIPSVATVKAVQGPATETIVLPGNVRGWHEAIIYARTNGYIKRWLVDIGYYVKAGDLLAEIETPELDEQLRQAEASLLTAEANYQLARITAKRWRWLLKTDSVSKQETDEKISAEKATLTIVQATRANRDRLRKLVGFERVIAPFDGVITSRTIDIGSLINAGSGGYPALFRIAQADPLRIYVRVPQNYAARIQPNMTVTLHFSEHPGKQFPAKLFKTAEAIDLRTRTLLVQFTANNKNHELLPGGYTQVHFKLNIPPEIVRIPVNTLLFRKEGLQVATIDGDSKVVLKHITINRDLGNIVEVNTGIKAGEQIILNPPDSIFSGQKVRLAESDPGNPL